MNSRENGGFNPEDIVKPDDFKDGEKTTVNTGQVGNIMERLRERSGDLKETRNIGNGNQNGNEEKSTLAVGEALRPRTSQEKAREENKSRLDSVLAAAGCDFRYSVLTGSSDEGYEFKVFIDVKAYRENNPLHTFTGARISDIEASIHAKFRDE